MLMSSSFLRPQMITLNFSRTPNNQLLTQKFDTKNRFWGIYKYQTTKSHTYTKFQTANKHSSTYTLTHLSLYSCIHRNYQSKMTNISLVNSLSKATFLLRLFRKRNTWDKYYELHLFQFKWNRNHSIPK